jgi:hypothetical protein
VESTPVGRWETYLLEPPSSEELGTPVPPLMHGVHQNPRAHELVGRWIEGLRAR